MDEFLELKRLMYELEKEALDLFQKDNQSAGIRLRKGLSKLRKQALQLRKAAAEKRTSRT